MDLTNPQHAPLNNQHKQQISHTHDDVHAQDAQPTISIVTMSGCLKHEHTRARNEPTVNEVSAEQFARLFRDNVWKHHGVPCDIVSDRDPRFTGKFLRSVCNLLQTRQSLSTPYHPQSDGQTERTNRILEDMLRHYVNPTQDDWDEHLATAQFAYNNAWQESIKETPFFLNYGCHPRTPMSHGLSSPAQAKVPAAYDFVKSMYVSIDNAKKALAAARDRQKRYADLRRRDVEFDVGDHVLVSTKNIKIKI